uniref:Peroxidase n=1 Tax=Cacopsylla melanoneura TaxID=428564 RepID=A0A8D9FEH5_9HEMI
MACSMLVVLVAVGIVFQFGSQTAMTSVLEASAFVKLPFASVNSYVNFYNDVSQSRNRRAVSRLPVLTSLELENSVSIAESFVSKMYTHEVNIAGSGVKILPGTPAQGQLIDSQPSLEALQMNRDALVALRASKYIASKHCLRLRISDDECARQLADLKLSPTSLGKKCVTGADPAFCAGDPRFRSQDDSCNHRSHPTWGMSNTPYRRLLFPAYDDGLSTPRGSSRSRPLPSPRAISVGMTIDEDRPDRHSTLALMQWGQFVFNDMAHTVTSHMFNTGSTINCCTPEGFPVSPRHSHSACFPIEVPKKDPFYAKFGRTCMNYVRSVAALRQDCSFGPLDQLNQATPVLDASMIYGTSDEVTASLRSFTSGKLLNNGNFLPQSSTPETDCQIRDSASVNVCYASGDSRVNLNPHTTVMYTLWMREHNRIADQLARVNPQWSDERLFQESRKLVGAMIQHITYNEFLPLVLGGKYSRRRGLALFARNSGYSDLYDEFIDPSVSNAFATAAAKFTNSLMSGQIELVAEDRSSTDNSIIELKEHYNSPSIMESGDNFDNLIRGLATQSGQKMDTKYSKAVTQFLYSDDSNYGLDAISLDIQRGRDHGLPGYNAYRTFCGLKPASSFEDLQDTIPKASIAKLKSLYKKVDDIDLIVGGISEAPQDGAVVGPTFRCILAEQFIKTRAGDRFFYDNPGQPSSFSKRQLDEIRKANLARVMCDNSDHVATMQKSVFIKPGPENKLFHCTSSQIPSLNLDAWREEEGYLTATTNASS